MAKRPSDSNDKGSGFKVQVYLLEFQENNK
jgi:hypothetical protein